MKIWGGGGHGFPTANAHEINMSNWLTVLVCNYLMDYESNLINEIIKYLYITKIYKANNKK